MCIGDGANIRAIGRRPQEHHKFDTAHLLHHVAENFHASGNIRMQLFSQRHTVLNGFSRTPEKW